MFLYFSSHSGACTGFAWVTRDWLKWTIALEQIVFPARKVNFGQAMYRNMYRSLERAPQDTQDGFDFGQYSVLICLAAHWSDPATSAQEVSAFLDYILRVCQSLQNSSVSLAGKALLVVYPMLSYSYDLPLGLEFRGKCCVEKGAWRASYPQLCILLYREWIRLSIKDNNN